MPNIKELHGTKDCDVFAIIAYAYHAVLEDDVSTIRR